MAQLRFGSEGAKPGQIPTKFRDVVLTSFLTNTFEVRLLPPFIRRIEGSLFVHEFVYFSTISNFRSRYDKIRAKLAGCSKADNQPG